MTEKSRFETPSGERRPEDRMNGRANVLYQLDLNPDHNQNQQPQLGRYEQHSEQMQTRQNLHRTLRRTMHRFIASGDRGRNRHKKNL